MQYVYNDGGKKEAGFKGNSGDCVCRSISIVTGLPYKEVYKALNQLAKKERIGKIKKDKSSARNGVYKHTYTKYLLSIGYLWVPTMKIGSGCKFHLKEEELPKGRLIVVVSKHLTAVIDGVLHDTSDCSRDGTRCVYGYFVKKEVINEQNLPSMSS
jgi:hypothetical protein